MAELAIPIVALGSLFVMSEWDKNKKPYKENYENLNKKNIKSDYPIELPVKSTNINYYPQSKQSVDKYFSEVKDDLNIENNSKNNNISTPELSIKSINGNIISKENFNHHNMQPFFGSSIKGPTIHDHNISEVRLDNLQGNGSQNFSKKESAPLFEPQKNLQWAHGAPDSNDFYMSRQNPSMKMSNIKPWDSVNVGPGLNKGYETSGTNGFNAGMEARETWLPKTVDELRVETNPKLTFGLEGHQGPALSEIKNRGLEGRVEKYRPDTYYDNNPDRWFTTTGLEKGERNRGEEILKEIKANCPQEYFGDAKNGDATYIKGIYEESTRPVLRENDVTPAYQPGSNAANNKDYGRDGYKILANNRNTTSNQEFGPVSGIVQAVIAPVLDLLKPTRKENVIGNIRKNGNINNNKSGNYVYNPSDITKITNRQMTENKVDLNHLNVDRQNADGYLVSEHQPVNVQRDTTNYHHMGIMAGSANQIGERSIYAENNQRNNCNKQQNSVVLPGNMSLLNTSQNLTTLKNDSCPPVRNQIKSGGNNLIPTKETHGILQNSQALSNQKIQARIEPDILSAFKSNPYTQNLTNIAAR